MPHFCKPALIAASLGALSTCFAGTASADITKACTSGMNVFPEDGQTVTYTGTCRQLNVSGNNNTVIAPGVKQLNVMGNGNTVTVGNVKDVKAGGDGNKIFYSGAEPDHWFGGDNNTLVAGGAQAPKTQAAAKTTKPRAETRTRTVKPGKMTKANGVRLNQIEEVQYLGKLTDIDILILLKDGTARWNPGTPIQYMDAAADKAKYAKHWRQWRRKGGVLQVRPLTGGDEWFDVYDQTPKIVRPAKKGMKMAPGAWKYASSQSFGTYGSSSTFARYTFSEDGRFKTSSSSIMGYSTPGVSSSGVASSCDETGQRSASSSTAAGGVAGSSSSGNGCGSANTGTYVISGYTLQLNADNGQVYHQPFYYIDDELVIIRGRWYGYGLD